jgi:hypothetical protein
MSLDKFRLPQAHTKISESLARPVSRHVSTEFHGAIRYITQPARVLMENGFGLILPGFFVIL